jgi:hypothetical protein
MYDESDHIWPAEHATDEFAGVDWDGIIARVVMAVASSVLDHEKMLVFGS